MPKRRHAQPPVETDDIAVGKPSRVAGTATAVKKVLEFALGEAGIVRGVSALYHLNQFDGVDSLGCGWPDPDDHRTHNEYCENGAKAIAEEATSKRITTEFSEQGSVSIAGNLTTASTSPASSPVRKAKGAGPRLASCLAIFRAALWPLIFPKPMSS
jgi:hypothetical protein